MIVKYIFKKCGTHHTRESKAASESSEMHRYDYTVKIDTYGIFIDAAMQDDDMKRFLIYVVWKYNCAAFSARRGKRW